MASYQIRQRDPLLDQTTQAMLEKRGKELLGLACLGLALVFALMLFSYSPKDPGWMVSTDEPAANYLGRIGAAVSSTLIIIVGKGAWTIPLILGAWGIRFLRHIGAERATPRLLFAVVGVALSAIFASTLSPSAGWSQTFGLGGLFGDTVLGALLGVMPGGAELGLRLAPLVLGMVALASLLFVTGFDRAELGMVAFFLRNGLVHLYDMAAGRAGQGAARTAKALRERAQARRATGGAHRAEAARAEPGLAAAYPAPAALATSPASRVRRAPPPVTFDDLTPDERVAPEWGRPAAFAAAYGDALAAPPAPAPMAAPRYPEPLAAQAHYAPPREKTGIFGKVAGLMARRADPEPELIEPLEAEFDPADLPDADRIRARINSAVQTRTAPKEGQLSPVAAAIQRRDSAMRPRGPVPLIADTRRPQTAPPLAASGLRAEPPLSASAAVPLQAAAPAAGLGTALAGPAIHSLRAFRGPDPEGAADLAPPAQPQRGAYAAPQDITNAFADQDDADLADWDAAYDLTAEPAPAPAPSRAAPLQLDRRAVVQHPVKKPLAPSSRALAEAQPRLRFDDPAPAYELPPLSLLSNPVSIKRNQLSDEALEENARMLENVLDDYGVRGEIVSVRPGPVVTMYELEPAPGLKASRVIGLADDIARSMSALSARVSTVPGRTVIGIELPNATREKVLLREILAARDFGDSGLRLPLALGKDIGGDPIVANLAKMPHLLIAGTTGSGKSVAINTMILSLLYKLTPEECRLIMIDPKMLELSVYDGIPHLLSPVVTDPKKAVVALKWVVGEMEERYRKMSKMGVRNIEGYNGRVREALERGEMFRRTIQTGFDEDTGEPVFETEEFAPIALPYIVVIVDEMADLMMVAGKEIEACIQRLAQMARASGIHLIMATQRPSVDVITGTIKANFPTRISFQVTSKIDSRTILGEQGAEQLLGMGDMLYMAGGGRISRIHGPFVSDEEVEEVVNHLKSFGPPAYMSGVVDGPEEDREADIDAVLGLGGGEASDDALYDQAVAIVARDRKCSTSYIQRKLGIGYNKAARLVEQMEDQGVVTPANHVGKREILIEER